MGPEMRAGSQAGQSEQTASSGYVGNNKEIYRVPTLDYWSFVTMSYDTFVYYWDRFSTKYRAEYDFPASFVEDVRHYCSIAPLDVFLVVFLAVVWSLIRSEFTTRICLPLSEKLQLAPVNASKLPESAWKLIFYSCTWAWSVFVMLYSGRYQTFWDPLSIWDAWVYRMSVPWDIYVTYIVQASFYLHSIYGTLYMDVWRKDSAVMIAHHILTLGLIGFSYSAGHYMEGALVLLLHDVTDVELEFTKLNSYLKRRGGRTYLVHELLANLGFACFAVSWFVFRLYWYPLKVLYVATYGTTVLGPEDCPFIPIFAVMLWLLLAMNIWWFHFILIVLYKVATGQMEELDDTREFEAQQKRIADELNRMASLADNERTTATTNHVMPDCSINGFVKSPNGTHNEHTQQHQNGFVSPSINESSKKKLD